MILYLEDQVIKSCKQCMTIPFALSLTYCQMVKHLETGLPKLGKSYFTLQICQAVADGLRYLASRYKLGALYILPLKIMSDICKIG